MMKANNMTTCTAAPAAHTLNAAAFVIERRALADALKPLCKVIEKRNTVPILAAIMLTVDADRVTLNGSDLDLELRLTLDCVDAVPGVAFVDAHALKASVAKLKGTRVRVAVIGGAVAVSDVSSGMTVRLAQIDRKGADWPSVPGSDVPGMTLSAPQLRDDIERALVAVSYEEARYYLNGIYIHSATDGGARVLRMATTDGHRLVRITRPLPADADCIADRGVILPRKACGMAAMLIGKGSGEAALSLSDARFTFAYGNATMTGKTVDGSFPDYSRVIPSNNPRGFDIAADVLGDAVAAVSAHCGTGKNCTPAVAFGFNASGWMTATASDPDNGRAGATLDATAIVAPDGDDFGTGVKAVYMRGITDKVFGGAARLEVRFQDQSAPILIESRDVPHVIAVQMPIRIDGGWIDPAAVAALNGGAIPAPAPVAPAVTPAHDDEPVPAPVTAPEPVSALSLIHI